jgi:pimeloyl-ACP methyl ester carboxylesterase
METDSNINLFVYEAGSPASPAIVFLHGSPLSGRMWLPQFEGMTEFHCLAPDLPGHGQSASIPLSMPDIVRRLEDLIRESTPDGKAHIAGLSFGGVVAQALMVAAPELVDHVILSGTAVRMSRVLVWMSMLNEPVLRLLRPEQLAALVCWQFGIPSRYRAMLGDDFKAFSAKTLSKVMQTYLAIEVPSVTRSPTLVAVGQKETVYARRAARTLSRAIPGARGVIIPDCGHVWNLEAPDLFAETVRAWVTDQPLPDRLMPLQ